MSTTKARNAAVRAALTAAFPHTRFTVTNGWDATVRISWTDGPTPTQVEDAAPDVFPGGLRAWYDLRRVVTDELVAVAALRTTDPPPIPQLPRARFATAHTRTRAPWVDAATVTPHERAQAHIVLALATGHPDWNGERTYAIALTADTHRDAILAATT
jgi:hypothetical protein